VKSICQINGKREIQRARGHVSKDIEYTKRNAHALPPPRSDSHCPKTGHSMLRRSTLTLEGSSSPPDKLKVAGVTASQ
jgi:hypothetical protein